ncbi:Helix-turn-helix domain containing protein [uncultured Caudovirales phage]|uniref:Helix-turn-helix domain containing protein n=1 Tax=uncultured Caudovirales phage TaxID=2100421 RepID=A0A6J5SFS8_9CAUD|nr:Helix-turn-helix domain containing protein [uncultured Caudovirales phage]CAB4199174.1 Helix-turn-helix domain containing protein [uncultured Caudovirales phage]CAB4213056.1 Helix-turn-helix domain containing protein [uncultured Caudovirales phage]CAB5227923.1 Helix-turn-helix domain containing protein [uncultured Caudovirales phage]
MKRIESRHDQLVRLVNDGIDDVEQELILAEDRGVERALSSQYLTIREAAAYLHCCRESIYNYIKSGRLTCVTSVSGRRLVPMSALVTCQASRVA